MDREVGSDGRANGEADREGDADEHECGGTAAFGGDVGEDGTGKMLGGLEGEGGRAYIDSWTFPSLIPPMARESMNDAKEVDWIHLVGVITG